MTQRIVTTLRSLALMGAVSLGLRKAALDVREPDPVRSTLSPGEENDGWLFERPQTNLASGAYMLEEQYARVSGTLSSLRGILTSLARVPELSEAPYVPPRDAPLAMDAMLFDEDRAGIPVLTNVVAFEDDDLFAEHTFSLPRIPAHQEDLARVA
ncbi:MAG: hypothetical protein ACK46Q_10520 [Hyphomonas sp.]